MLAKRLILRLHACDFTSRQLSIHVALGRNGRTETMSVSELHHDSRVYRHYTNT